MKAWRLFFIFSLFFISFSLSPKVYSALTFGNGTYTNLCGTGLSASSDTCNRGCNTGTGTCSSSGSYVVKWTCDGKQTECRGNETSFSTSQSLAGTACGKTVQIDVFDTVCRVNGNWVCGDRDHLQDYIVWYSGDCIAPTSTPAPTASVTPSMTPTPSPTPVPAIISSCDSLIITNGNNSTVPTTVTLKAQGSDNRGSIQAYRFFWGDGRFDETTSSELSHRYEVSGTFLARAEVKDSQGAWKSSGQCETTVTVQSVAVESQKSDCSDLFIAEGNYTQAPTTARFTVSGYDNKGSLKRYKVDFGDGTTNERGDSNRFEHRYERAGTYITRGYILDSRDNWKGGAGSCERVLYVNTAPLTKQPATGTPTAFTLLSLTAGIWVSSLFFVKKFLIASS